MYDNFASDVISALEYGVCYRRDEEVAIHDQT